MIDIDKIVKEITEPILNEGVNDPGILKAVFLAGGPGSGKSFAANQLFGIPSKMNVSAYGLKMVNQDAELERMLKKYGYGLDLDDMPEELFRQLTDPDYEDYSGMRGRAKELTAARKKMYMNGRLGMIIDGTGHKFKKIKEQKKELEEIGYDCYMVFVHTDLEVAQKRNMTRARKLNPEIVETSWKEVQANKIYFQGLFGGANFLMVDNSATLSPKQATKKFNMLVKKGIGKFINKPVKNYRGKKWIAKQKIMKENAIVGSDGVIQGSSKISKIKKMKKKGHTSVPYGSGYKKVKEASCAKKTNTETAAQYRKRCGPRPLGQIPKINESEVKKIHSLLQKFGNSSKEATNIIKKHYKKVTKKFSGQSSRDKAMAMIGLSLLGENNKTELMKLYNKAFKMMPGSPKQKELIKKITALRKKLKMDEAPRKPRKKGQHRNSPNHSDLYTDENPKGTIKGLKFATVQDATKSVSKIKSSGKSHAHKIQAAVAMEQRAREMGKSSQAAVYRKFINQMKKKTKKKTEIAESKNIKKVIGVFGGRFQPFHSGHLATYKWLSKRVDEAYITTSNIKKPPRHPMNFKEKVRHMVKVGVPKNRIIEEKTPYVATNLLKKFNPKTTAVVYAFGEKDAGRLKGGRKADGSKTYYQEFQKNKSELEGFEEHGYFVTAPQSGNISGTKTREMLGSPTIHEKEKKKFFKRTFGYFDQGLYNMMTNKFGKLYEFYVSLLESATGDIESVDDGPHAIAPGINRYMGRARKEAEKLGFDIVNSLITADAYNSQDKLKSHAKPYPDGPVDSVSYGPAGIGDVTSNSVQNLIGTKLWNKWLNHIDKILGDTNFEYTSDLIKSRNISVKDSKETAKELDKELKESIQRLVSDLPTNGRELLLMGGAYGHMSHPFDDKDLTFGDLKKIITLGLSGQLNREDNVTEKTDGQNLMISFRDGKLIAARNKGHLKNRGKTALDIKAVESKFKGRGAIRDAFVYAMRDLSKAIGSLSKKQQDKIFGQGSKFMSLEVMWPASENVVNYDLTELIFHGAMEYDESGKVIGQAKDSARMLQGMIKQVNQHVQKHYKISKPHFVTVPKHQDYGKLKKKFLGKLQKLQNIYALKDNDTFALYHQMYWEEFIYNASKQYGYKIPNTILKKLTKRWAFFDKSYKIPQIKKELKDQPKFLDWVLTTDKIDKNRMVKENMKPFEELFFEVGAEILKNMDGWMAVNPAKSVQNMRKKLKAAISDIRAGGDVKKLNKLKIQLDRLNAIGGFDAVVPTEGIVFKYNGNTYKFTGAFAPINQITGLMFF